MKLNHIGFLTKDVEAEKGNFDLLFPGIVWSRKFVDVAQDVTAYFGRTPDGLVYELIEPNSEKSPIAQSLKARKNILNHMCYTCDNLELEAQELRKKGMFPVTEPKSGIAFGNNLIQFFFHPNGLLLELIEGNASPFDPAERDISKRD